MHLLARRVRVQVAAHVLNLNLQVPHRARLQQRCNWCGVRQCGMQGATCGSIVAEKLSRQWQQQLQRQQAATTTSRSTSSTLHSRRRRSRSSQLPAHMSAAHRGALEGHVLQEVRRAVAGIRLVAAAGIDPHTHGGGARVGHVLRGHAQAVGQAGDLQPGTASA